MCEEKPRFSVWVGGLHHSEAGHWLFTMWRFEDQSQGEYEYQSGKGFIAIAFYVYVYVYLFLEKKLTRPIVVHVFLLGILRMSLTHLQISLSFFIYFLVCIIDFHFKIFLSICMKVKLLLLLGFWIIFKFDSSRTQRELRNKTLVNLHCQLLFNVQKLEINSSKNKTRSLWNSSGYQQNW